MNSFERGDRVKSNVAGYYYGAPGTIRGLSQVQYDSPRYTIDLDIGKPISLRAYDIKKINKDE